jgi:hypothetical protein
MALEAKLSTEAVAVAAGNHIYCYSYSGNVRKIAERSGAVRALTIYHNRLLDCGNYKGIRDTLTNELVAGNGDQWSHIATTHYKRDEGSTDRPSELLYGVNDKELNIFRLTEHETRGRAGTYYTAYDRNGQTTVLHGCGPILYDGGKYYYYGGRDEKTYEYHVKDSFSEDFLVAFGAATEPVTALASLRGERYTTFWYTTPTTIMKHAWQYPYGGTRELHRLKTPLTQFLHTEPLFAPSQGDLIRRKRTATMHKFSQLTNTAVPELDVSASRWGLHFSQHVVDHIAAHEGYSAVAYAEKLLFVGRATGELATLDAWQTAMPEQVQVFQQPIAALCTINEETFDDGLRQKVTRAIQMRALHAQKRPAALRRAA